jgi:hypothetical protein
VKPIYYATSISLVLPLVLACISLAEDISVSASVDRKIVSVGNVITLTIHIQGTQSRHAPDLPNIDGFQSLYLGPSTQISIVNGQSSVSVAHRYSLLAMKTGQFTIPSMAVEYEGRTYRTDPIRVQVVSGSDVQQGGAATPGNLKEHIYLTISTGPGARASLPAPTAYLNEEILLLIQLYIRRGLDVRNIRMPAFSAAGFSVVPLDKDNVIQQQTTIGGVRFHVITFPTTIYPVTTGELALGPAELNCELMGTRSRSPDPFFDSFFGQRERHLLTIRSDPYTISVKPLPKAGQPESFSGAVGQYELDVEAKPTSLKVGEPITLTMTIRGRGNLDMVKIPEIADLNRFKVYDPQIKDGTKERTFEQVLIPRSADIKAIPEIQFSYFDPEVGQYRTQTRGPIPIQVAPSDEAEPLQILEIAEGRAVKREVLGRDIVYIKDEVGAVKRGDGHLYKSKGFLLIQLLPLFGFAGVLVYQRRRDRFATDRAYARQYHAPRKAKKGLAHAQKLIASGQSEEFCSTVFKTVQEYLGDRFDLPFAGITIEIVDSLRSQGAAEEILEKLAAFFEACDRIRFAQSEMSQREMSAILDLATESIKLLENVNQ